MNSRMHGEYVQRRLEELENASESAAVQLNRGPTESPEPELNLVGAEGITFDVALPGNAAPDNAALGEAVCV
jgi:hypothetical protein